MAMLLTMDNNQNSFYKILSSEIKIDLLDTDPYHEYKKMAEFFHGYDHLNQMLFTDLKIVLIDAFLEKVDKSTMAVGVESRVPLLENELTDFMLTIPSNLKLKKGIKKYILKKSLKGVLPDYVLNSPKKGFAVPYGMWLKGPLKKYSESVLFDNTIKKSRIFNNNALRAKFNKFHDDYNQHDAFILWKALNLSIWYNKYNINI